HVLRRGARAPPCRLIHRLDGHAPPTGYTSGGRLPWWSLAPGTALRLRPRPFMTHNMCVAHALLSFCTAALVLHTPCHRGKRDGKGGTMVLIQGNGAIELLG